MVISFQVSDPNIYGTVNVGDWYYQKDNNLINLTGYRAGYCRQDTEQIIVPNLNDFNNAGVKIGNAAGVGISSVLTKNLASRSIAFAISKTSGNYNNKVIATDQNWSGVFNGAGIGAFSQTALINVDVSNLDTRNITNMSSLFAGSWAETVGDLSQWNTSNVTNMSYLFSSSDNYPLNNVGDLGKWDTRSVTDMSGMFDGSRIVPGNIGNWNVSNVKNMTEMFDGSGGGDIGDLSQWNTSNVTDMSYMFYGSSASVSGLTHWNTKNVYMDGMFDNSSLPYKIVASNASAVIPNQVTLKDSTGKILALIDTPTIYDSNKSVKATINEIVQAEVTKLNNLNKTLYGTPRIVSDDNSDYSIANAVYVVDADHQSISDSKKTGSINYVDQDGKVIKTDTISGKVGDQINVKLSLPDGYELANTDEQIPSSITVGEDGIKPITIQVKKLPVVQTGSINYVDQDGKIIKTDTISGKVGDQINVKLSLPDGYELANKDEQIPSTVTVTEDGISPISVNIKKINTTPTTPVNPTEPNNPTNPAQPSNPTTLPTGQPGWSQQNGNWYYFNNQGSASTGWQKLNNWYYFDPNNGQMLSGLQSINNKYYYLNQNHDGTFGAMQTGWQWINGNWYGLKGDGSAYLGWQKLNGRWYYFDDENANALTGWQKLNGRWYYFDPTNAWAQTGWFKSGAGYWYFFDYSNAWALTDWQKLNGRWYYFDTTNASSQTGWFQSQAGNWYYFDPTNAWALTGWQYINGHWYWFDSVNAWAKTGWQWYNGNWYFMDQQNAWMMTGWATNTTNDQLYYLDQNGHPVTGWQRDSHGFWYYLQPGSDATAIGWKQINGNWYYFNPEDTINGIRAKGAMFTGRHMIEDRWSNFDENGHWLGYEEHI